jgi:hypothetical protein
VNFQLDFKVAATLADLLGSAQNKPMPEYVANATQQVRRASEAAAAKATDAAQKNAVANADTEKSTI